MCRHIIGIAARYRLVEIPEKAKNVSLGERRKRGRPKKARAALMYQPSDCSNYSTGAEEEEFYLQLEDDENYEKQNNATEVSDEADEIEMSALNDENTKSFDKIEKKKENQTEMEKEKHKRPVKKPKRFIDSY